MTSDTALPVELITDIRDLIRAAWALCDNTANENPPEVDQRDWDTLSAALNKLDLLPDVAGVVAGPATKAEHALLRALSATRTAVKPMEWKENSHISLWTGELVFGVYYTAYDEGGGWRVHRGQFLSEASADEIAFGPKAVALAAAQSDYERRILSALSTTEGE